MRLSRLSMLCGLAVFAATFAHAQVLGKFETYQCEPFPSEEYASDETYYDMQEYRQPVPPSKVEALVSDLYQRLEMDLGLGISPSMVRIDHIKRAISVYLQVDWFDIAGYLPWTISHFLRGLSEDERDILAVEVYRYIQDNGVFDIGEIERNNNRR